MGGSVLETRFLRIVPLLVICVFFSLWFLAPSHTQALEVRLAGMESRLRHLEKLQNVVSPPTSSPRAPFNPVFGHDMYEQCAQWEREWGVVVGVLWGTANESQQAAWSKAHCDQKLTTRHKPPQRGQMPADYNYAASANVIAVCVASTTRTLADPSFSSLFLFTKFFPSFRTTLEPEFEYRVYVGYDKGDVFFETVDNNTSMQAWFKQFFKERLDEGIKITLHLVRVDNVQQKPGPVFNEMLKVAYQDKPHFFYRLNDDSIMKTAWASALRNWIIGFGPPYGAVGPWCPEGNTNILTHDFVHRTHMEIFNEVYYPPVFSDWWMDDWITKVYGRLRTRRVQSVKVEHRIAGHKTRYLVDPTHGHALREEIVSARKKIADWMRAHNLPQETIRTFLEDDRPFHVRDG